MSAQLPSCCFDSNEDILSDLEVYRWSNKNLLKPRISQMESSTYPSLDTLNPAELSKSPSISAALTPFKDWPTVVSTLCTFMSMLN